MMAHCTDQTVTNATLDSELIAELRDPTRIPRQETTNEDGSLESAAIPEGLQAVMQVKSSQVAGWWKYL